MAASDVVVPRSMPMIARLAAGCGSGGLMRGPDRAARGAGRAARAAWWRGGGRKGRGEARVGVGLDTLAQRGGDGRLARGVLRLLGQLHGLREEGGRQ